MLAEAEVGPKSRTDGGIHTLRSSKDSSIVVSQSHGKYYEGSSRGKMFYAANQTATTWSVALNATHTGLVVSNPSGSTVDLAIKQVSFGLSVAPAAIAHIGVFGGYLAAGITTHTTPLTPASCYIGSPAGTAKADAAATLVGTPVWLMPIMGGFTAAALPSTSPVVIDIDGMFVVPPGGYFGIGALTAVIGFGAIAWEEIAK
jgi:hypothetical protein